MAFAESALARAENPEPTDCTAAILQPDAYRRAQSRYQRAERYAGRRPSLVLELIRLRALSAMLDARKRP